MHHRQFGLAVVLAVLGCEKSSPSASASAPPVSASAPPASASPAASAPAPVTTVSPMKTIAPAELPKDLKLEGKTVNAVGFTDKNGENIVVFTSRTIKKGEAKSAYLTVDHVAHPNGVRKSLRTIHDKDEDCDLDQTADFLDNALEVTDLDKDGYGEVTFAYAIACRSDMSAEVLKLLVIENGDKYILRGTTRIGPKGMEVGGELKVDPSFSKGPPEFLTHAKKSWDKVVKRP